MEQAYDIFDSFWTRSDKATLVGDWHAIPCDPSFRRLDKSAFQQVLDSSTPKMWTAARLVYRAGGKLRVTKALQKLPTTLKFVRAPGEVKVLQVIAGLQGLSARMGAAAALLQDSVFCELMKDWVYGAVLTSSMADLQIFTSLGIPAVLATGLARVTATQLDILIRLWTSRFDGPLILIIPAFRLHDLRLYRCGYLEQVSNHLGQFERLLNLDFEFRWWTPTPTKLSDLAFLIRNGSTAQLKTAITHSLEGYSDGIARPEWIQEPHDLVSALERWRHELGIGDREGAKNEWKSVQRYLQRQIVEPFFLEALISKSTDRVRMSAAAPLLQGMLGRLFQLGQHIATQLEQGLPSKSAVAQADLKTAIALAKNIRELIGPTRAH